MDVLGTRTKRAGKFLSKSVVIIIQEKQKLFFGRFQPYLIFETCFGFFGSVLVSQPTVNSEGAGGGYEAVAVAVGDRCQMTVDR